MTVVSSALLSSTQLRKDLHENIVEMVNVVKTYGSVLAVDGINLTIKQGEIVALLGPNGAGKTTSINMLLGLLTPTAGSIRMFGMEPVRAIQQSRVGAMLQEGKLISGVRIGEFLDFVRNLYPAPLSKDELIEIAGLGGLLNRSLDRLSGGQSQRVKLAMAIAGNPDLLLLDEPTAAMDVESRHEFWTSMQNYAASGHTILFATHYLEEAESFASRVVIIASGHIAIDGTIDQIQRQYGGKQVMFSLKNDDIADLASLQAVQSYERQDKQVTLHTDDADATVRSLAASDIPWQNLNIAGISLEDIFLSLIHKGDAQ